MGFFTSNGSIPVLHDSDMEVFDQLLFSLPPLLLLHIHLLSQLYANLQWWLVNFSSYM